MRLSQKGSCLLSAVLKWLAASPPVHLSSSTPNGPLDDNANDVSDDAEGNNSSSTNREKTVEEWRGMYYYAWLEVRAFRCWAGFTKRRQRWKVLFMSHKEGLFKQVSDPCA